MKKSTKLLLLCLMLLIISVMPAAAQVATLAWDQNTQPEVVGYKVYYQIDSPTFPFNGTSLSEGASPITIYGAEANSLAIDLPEDGNIYYFTATALGDTGLESSFSDIIASEWIPYLLAPTKNAAVETSATFLWDLPPTDYNVTYELHYGTDPNLQTAIAAVAASSAVDSGWPQLELVLAVPLAMILSLLMLLKSGQAKHVWHPIRVGFCIGLFALQASCGGSAGGDPASDPGTTTPPPSEPIPLTTSVVTGISNTTYQVTDLQPGAEYYWKIIAIDGDGYPYESIIQSFTTLPN